MQQLQAKLKNTPTDASKVRSSVSSALNREETPSVQDKVLTCNNPEGNPLQHAGGQNLRVSAVVYVLSIRGVPLMPTSPRNARKLVSNNKAKIVRRFPFVIKLTEPTGETIQKVTMGIDGGYKNVGFSCTTANKELASGEIELDGRTSDRLTERRMYRRGRRSKLWYRAPRFNNRCKPNSWLPPSVQRRYEAHLLIINRLKSLMPISQVIVETGNFDIQKIQNPDIAGQEYQRGNLYQFDNVKSYVISREKGKCQHCGKDKGNDVWQIHHIIMRKDGGSNRPDNLCLLHSKCHDKIHKHNLEKTIKKNKQYKESTFMSIIHHRFQSDMGCEITYGYITHSYRNSIGLPKSHANDALAIAKGRQGQKRCLGMSVVQKHKNNRGIQLNRKGFAPAIRKNRYACQPKDLIKVGSNIFEVIGTHCKGKSVMAKCNRDGKKIDIPSKKIIWKYHFNSLTYSEHKTVNISKESAAIHPHE